MIATLSRDDYRQFNENIGILQEAGTEIPFVVTHNEDDTFTVELKTTRANKIKFSPHQIAFHIRHPKNTFIIVKSLGQSDLKLFHGAQIRQLAACGFKLDPCSLGLESIIKTLEA